MKRFIVALIAAASVIAAPASAHVHGCNTHACDVRIHNRHHRAHQRHVIAPYLGWLSQVRHCEWDPYQRWHTNTGNGFYGAYQFTLKSWYGVGGRGYPHQATPLEQSYRAVRLRFSQGTGAWPVCG